MNKIVVLFFLFLALACTERESVENQEQESFNDQNTGLNQFGMSNEDVPKGLMEGDQAPFLEFLSPTGEAVSLKSLYDDKPLVVIFYRGYWCPVCNRYLSDLTSRFSEIEKAGARVVAFTPETYGNTLKTIENTEINFSVFSDTDGTIMRAFDVDFEVTAEYHEMIDEKLGASIKDANAKKEAILPVPATFIIDKDGKIVYRQFYPDYKKRASVNEILAHLPSERPGR